ncbi:MAG: 3-dehydroquinate synthase [Candidatus Pelagibacter sp.]|nr:3-dehydroquinate synthase [Candidatus Pelagibacter sp.]
MSKKKNENYSLFIGSDLLRLLPRKLKSISPKGEKVAIIYDKNVPIRFKSKAYKILKKFKRIKISINPNEKNKSIDTVNKILNILFKNNFNRNDFIISIGGGITGDMVAFTASIFKRGINFINVPSTFLAQVDSSLGGKTGVNNQFGKNLIGTFYQPKIVIIDTNFLKSLKKKDFLCGYAEILKHSIIHDKKFFYWLEKNSKKILLYKDTKAIAKAIDWSCKIKRYYVVKDHNEKDFRKILNFGHTVAHAIEAGRNYSNFTGHGEAVLIGMILETQLSYRKKICSIETLKRIQKIYLDNNLKKYLKLDFFFKDIKKTIKFMENDKKNDDNRINFILLKDIGKTTLPGKIKFEKKDLIKEFNKLKNFNF